MWSTYLFQTRTGQIGPRVEFSQASWTLTINENEVFNGTMKKSAIPMLESSLWLEPWWVGVLLLWNNTPIFAGPMTSRPTEGYTGMNFACGGVRSLFEKRSAAPDINWTLLSANSPQISAWHFETKDVTYATIARRAVASSLTKHGGDLPIRYMMPEKAFIDPAVDLGGAAIAVHDRPHYRRYPGYAGLTHSVDSILREMSELENGPDIMFRPALVGSTIEWQMFTGVDDSNPEIPFDAETVWDTTAQAGYISDLTLNYSSKDLANRWFTIGQAGTGAGSLIRMSEDQSKRDLGFPLLEGMSTLSGVDNKSRTQDKANADLRANDKGKQQLNGTVRADGINQLGTFWPGEYGRLITSGWYGIKSNDTRAKILSMSGDLSNNVQIGFKETEVA